MGLLDEAIREHLELKRRHGAGASEVAQQEHEALGPVRREDIAIPDGPTADAVEADLDGTGPPAPAPEAEVVEVLSANLDPAEPVDPPPADVAAKGERTALEPNEAAAAEPVADAGLGQPTVSFSLADLEAAGASDATEAPVGAGVVDEPTQAHPAPTPPEESEPEEAEAAAPPPRAPEPARTEDLTWDPPPPTPSPPLDDGVVEPAPDVDPGDVGHDELEETPDFLQETPEHDRLWFEQKPPRDFDF